MNYYDERYYLNNDKNSFAIDAIESERVFIEETKEGEKGKFSELYYSYDGFINKVVKLIKELKLPNNEISYSIVIRELIKNGCFSLDGNFSLRLGNISELYSKLGVNVVLGYGCCRHVCYFHKDVMDKVFDNGECLFVSVTDFKNRISGMKKPATHSINLITHKDVLYGFDTLNGGLYNFESEFHLEKLSKNKTHFYYKPYLHMIFENYSMTDVKNSLVRYRIASYLKKIDISEYDEISLYTKDKICNGKNLITDFVIDTNEDKNKIKKLMLV